MFAIKLSAYMTPPPPFMKAILQNDSLIPEKSSNQNKLLKTGYYF